MGETSLRRGHSYLTLFVDLDEARVLFATEGRESDTFAAFREDLEVHGGDPERIWELCMDMSPAYQKSAREHLPRARTTFDRFHVVKLLNEAVDQVRRAERKDAPRAQADPLPLAQEPERSRTSGSFQRCRPSTSSTPGAMGQGRRPRWLREDVLEPMEAEPGAYREARDGALPNHPLYFTADGSLRARRRADLRVDRQGGVLVLSLLAAPADRGREAAAARGDFVSACTLDPGLRRRILEVPPADLLDPDWAVALSVGRLPGRPGPRPGERLGRGPGQPRPGRRRRVPGAGGQAEGRALSRSSLASRKRRAGAERASMRARRYWDEPEFLRIGCWSTHHTGPPPPEPAVHPRAARGFDKLAWLTRFELSAHRQILPASSIENREGGTRMRRRGGAEVASTPGGLPTGSPRGGPPGDVGAACALVGESPAIREVERRIRAFAPSYLTVLIRGETGTGKGVVARRLHRASGRDPLLAVNLGALPRNLCQSELFGHVKGAFTGADRNRSGVFQRARGGTVFLDEVGNTAMENQPSLLRVLEERQVRPVGADDPRDIEVRVIAATNEDLNLAMEEGRFRPDLYYRLKGAEISLPPLRDRREDIPLLALHFSGGNLISPEALELLQRFSWPGNVRELQSTVRTSITLANGSMVLPEHLPELISDSDGAGSLERMAWEMGRSLGSHVARDGGPGLKALAKTFEAGVVEGVKPLVGGSLRQVATRLGVSEKTISRRLQPSLTPSAPARGVEGGQNCP